MRVRFLVDTAALGSQYRAGAVVWLDGAVARRFIACGVAVPVGPTAGVRTPTVGVRHGDPVPHGPHA